MLKQTQGGRCTRIREMLEKSVIETRLWKQQFIVDMGKMIGSCMAWSLLRIPCVNAIATIHRQGLNPHEMIDECYNKAKFL